MRLNNDLCCGLLFVLIALVFGYQALFKLEIGTLRNMGPGFFPMVLSIITMVIGIAIAIPSLRSAIVESDLAIPWRGLATISVAPILFGFMIGPFGMVPSILVLAAVSSLASRKTTPMSAVGTSVVLAAICAGIFVYGLGMPIPLFGPLIITP